MGSDNQIIIINTIKEDKIYSLGVDITDSIKSFEKLMDIERWKKYRKRIIEYKYGFK